MDTKWKLITGVLAIILIVLLVKNSNANKLVDELVSENPVSTDFLSLRPQIEKASYQSISPLENAGLLFMREEEKLARDVYLKLYEKWGLNIFSNIAQSEQTHTESVRTLLVKYYIVDPVKDDSIGVFVNKDLASLYTDLVAEGEKSLLDALKVGALIEDLDIKDLKDQISKTDNDDIKLVYENLMRGSRNHLRSFVKQIESRGGTYEPKYISKEEFDSIVSTSKETGSGAGGRGWGNN